MKNYNSPELSFTMLSSENVITNSTSFENNGLTIVINNEAEAPLTTINYDESKME